MIKKEFSEDSLEKLQRLHDICRMNKLNTIGGYQRFADCFKDIDCILEMMQLLLDSLSEARDELEYDACDGRINRVADYLHTMMQTADSIRCQSGLLALSVEKAACALEKAVKTCSAAAEQGETP